ncbi:hypothetical protein NQ318_011531 [Aromia moschata]|uniref:Uncharacterized protein n=1 Tax=Aromia moschata TaxID=1265417 RepID=A0AAV8Z6N6_9CUCU|nr:hypothetical protein NQ318_011531 [Aromia moschata]
MSYTLKTNPLRLDYKIEAASLQRPDTFTDLGVMNSVVENFHLHETCPPEVATLEQGSTAAILVDKSSVDEQRCAIRFRFRLEHRATDTLAKLQHVLGDSVFSRAQNRVANLPSSSDSLYLGLMPCILAPVPLSVLDPSEYHIIWMWYADGPRIVVRNI